MKIETINNKKYKLPNSLNKFQKELYVHLINYKWKHITKEVGLYKYNGEYLEYDAILPESIRKKYPLIYPSILNDLNQHLEIYPFKLHTHFNHMASSQAANVNLFLPILLGNNANAILKELKPDFKSLAIEYLYKGFRIEYWDENSNEEKGLLGDHNARSGTDCDIAIAYYNTKDELCLWLIEHKLTEKEFTECGGYKSNGRDKEKHRCEKSFEEICKNKNLCYYHDVRGSNYWGITTANKDFFINNDANTSCPFKNGRNQLWRNQLLGFAIEQDEKQPYKEVCFSVVHHPKNTYLNNSMEQYNELIGNKSKFFSFTSKQVIDAASKIKDTELEEWIDWYKELYVV